MSRVVCKSVGEGRKCERIHSGKIENSQSSSYFFINSSPEVGLCVLRIFISLQESLWYSHKNFQSLLARLVISKPVSDKEKSQVISGQDTSWVLVRNVLVYLELGVGLETAACSGRRFLNWPRFLSAPVLWLWLCPPARLKNLEPFSSHMIFPSTSSAISWVAGDAQGCSLWRRELRGAAGCHISKLSRTDLVRGHFFFFLKSLFLNVGQIDSLQQKATI